MVHMMRLYNILKNRKVFICIKQCHRNVCVRFAPSPTGNIHLGGLRTALLNYLFAKKHNGKFILRLEDTDQSRIVPGSAENLEKILTLTGIIPDEGPSQGGPNGPYIQSQRLNIYKSKIQDLINNKSAYKCFCTESRLEILRKEAAKRQETPRYDNKCRYLSEKEIEKLTAKKTPYCIRFKLEEGPLTFSDLVHGEVTITLGEGDPVIIKSDGFPTYHFACVVDDHLMEVTHVLRGVEWQISTPKHLMLYKAFGWKPTSFAHLPLLLNNDGSKLSKRHGDIDIENLLNRGFYPEAIVNLVASIGGGFGQLYDQLRVRSMTEMIEKFDFNKTNVKPCKVDFETLNHFNKSSLANQIEDSESKNRLVESFEAILRKEFGSNNVCIEREALEHILVWSITRKRVSILNDLLDPLHMFLWKRPTLHSESFQQKDGNVLEAVVTKLQQLPEDDFEANKLGKMLKEVCTQQNHEFKSFMHLLRLTLSGKKVGPSVAEMLEMLGKSESLNRIKYGVRTIGEGAKKYFSE